MGESRNEILRGLTVAELRAAHWCVARELGRRGEPVALVLPEEAGDREKEGPGRRTVRLPGLRAAIFRKRTTVADLARDAGVRHQTVAAAAEGRGRTQIRKARAIADALGVELDELRASPPVVCDLSPSAAHGSETRGAA